MNPLTNEEQQILQNDNWGNLTGFVITLDFVPAYTPKNIRQQFVMVTAGGSSRAYLYDLNGRSWRYWALT